MSGTKFRRILLKLSGEALMGDGDASLDPATLARVASDIKQAVDLGIQICIVVGGGNIFRGAMGSVDIGIDRATADYMGMMATVMNALAVQGALEKVGIPARVQSAIPMVPVCESFARRKAVAHLEGGKVVIFAAGTGNPFFTTDTAAALRAREMECDALCKATKVDGVYDSDPAKNPAAIRIPELTHGEALARELKVMDAAAFAVCREGRMPILVFSLKTPGGLAEVVQGNGIYTLVKGD
ncbi:MAG TPA: UMP kinase [Rhodospirillaceae bacterium]|nr:MAG: UMP kinase [Alphaproteobacteria bacterium GWF2_58_20]HAU28483.1 UMP kinase [Rhodospirillaceae bacterium]